MSVRQSCLLGHDKEKTGMSNMGRNRLEVIKAPK